LQNQAPSNCPTHGYKGRKRPWKLLALICLLSISWKADSATCVSAPPDLVAWFPGDGNANDIIGGNAGTLLNGAGFDQGLVDQAFNFDGLDDSVFVPNSPSLGFAGAFTVEFWFSPTMTITPATSPSPGFLSKGSFDSIGLANTGQFGDPGGYLEVRGPVPRPITAPHTWFAGIWYHAAVTYDTTSYSIYVNGVLEAGVASTYSILSNNNDVELGSIPGFGPGAHFNGRIDEMSIYDRALSSAEVQSIFNAGVNGKCKESLTFAGFLSPIDGGDATGGSFSQPLRSFKLNSTIPVKFTAFSDSAPKLDGVHTLQAVKWSDETNPDSAIDATPTDAATTGNQFRLGGTVWHFNLDTKATGMSVGKWQLIATLSDGSEHTAWIQIK